MVNKHFIKRLFTFVIIIACGAVLTVVVNYMDKHKKPAVSDSGLEFVN
jgi:hypothetical protein